MAKPSPLPTLFLLELRPGLSDRDLETLLFFGVSAVLLTPGRAPASNAKELLLHFDTIVGRELKRVERLGLRAYVGLGVHPLSVPRRGLSEVLSVLPEYFRGGKVVTVCEVGLVTGSEDETEAATEQLRLAKGLKLPVIASAPAADKLKRTRALIGLLQQSGLNPARVLVDGADSRTLRLLHGCGFHAALSLHPDELSAEAAVALVKRHGSEKLVVGSELGGRAGDILALPRAARLLQKAKLSDEVIAKVLYDNVVEFLRVRA